VRLKSSTKIYTKNTYVAVGYKYTKEAQSFSKLCSMPNTKPRAQYPPEIFTPNVKKKTKCVFP
jgi:hypothetical protein